MARTAASALAAALVAGTALIAATGAQAAASGTIRLQGSVAVDCAVTVTDNAVALNLTGGESNRAVGQVVETCNSGTGYTISITSANNGSLASAGTGTAPIAYTVGYDGTNGSLNAPLVASRNQAQFGRAATLTVSVPASTQYIAGTYQDTVTVTIAAR